MCALTGCEDEEDISHQVTYLQPQNPECVVVEKDNHLAVARCIFVECGILDK